MLVNFTEGLEEDPTPVNRVLSAGEECMVRARLRVPEDYNEK